MLISRVFPLKLIQGAEQVSMGFLLVKLSFDIEY